MSVVFWPSYKLDQQEFDLSHRLIAHKVAPRRIARISAGMVRVAQRLFDLIGGAG